MTGVGLTIVPDTENAAATGGPLLELRRLEVDHGRLKEMIDLVKASLDSAARGHYDQASTDVFVSFMVTYIKYHFEYEEEVMAKYAYPDLVKHCAEHREMEARVVKFREDIQHNPGDLIRVRKLESFVQAWLAAHTDKVDGKFEDYLRSRAQPGLLESKAPQGANPQPAAPTPIE